MHRSRRPLRSLLLVAAGVLALAVPAVGAVAAPPGPAGPPDGTRGAEAIARLGDRLPEVATEHGMSATRLRDLLRTDDTLFVDATDRLFYVRPEAPQRARTDRGDATASGRRQATVSWTDNASDETGFVVEVQKQRGNGSWGDQGSVQVGANTTSTTIDAGRGTFRFVVRAINGDGSSPGATSNVVDLG